jgi:hypothetical protein
MKKIAFFVEGRTESNFIIKLIEEAYDKKEIAITSKRGKGGANVEVSFTVISADSITDDTKFHVLIINCTGESNLRTYINDRREDLIKDGFTKIIGIRDVYPNFERKDIPLLERGLYCRMPQKPIETEFIISVMEMETCFLSEQNHFSKIHNGLTADLIHSSLGFHPVNDDMQLRDAPSVDLHSCYNIVGESYTKDAACIDRTIANLDYNNIYYNLKGKVQHLNRLITNLDDFFHS